MARQESNVRETNGPTEDLGSVTAPRLSSLRSWAVQPANSEEWEIDTCALRGVLLTQDKPGLQVDVMHAVAVTKLIWTGNLHGHVSIGKPARRTGKQIQGTYSLALRSTAPSSENTGNKEEEKGFRTFSVDAPKRLFVYPTRPYGLRGWGKPPQFSMRRPCPAPALSSSPPSSA